MPEMVVDTEASVKRAEKELARLPTLFHNAITKSVNSTVKAGRLKLIGMLSSEMAVRWKTILKKRAKYTRLHGGYADVHLSDEPMSATSFRGKYSSGNYNLQVLKSGWTIVVPAAFKGKDIDGKFSLFSRDMNSPTQLQTVGHFRKNIGKLRHTTHKVPPIIMSRVIKRRPEIASKLSTFLTQTFEKKMDMAIASAAGKK